jgi:hypothetical protein
MDANREILVRNTYVNLRVRLSEIMEVVRIIKERTRAANISTAIELVFHAGLPRDEMERVSVLVTLVRCIKDGSVAPPVNMDELYESIAIPP